MSDEVTPNDVRRQFNRHAIPEEIREIVMPTPKLYDQREVPKIHSKMNFSKTETNSPKIIHSAKNTAFKGMDNFSGLLANY